MSLGNLYSALDKEAQLQVSWDNMHKEPTATFIWCGEPFIIRYNEQYPFQPWDIIHKKLTTPKKQSFREGKNEVRLHLLLWLEEIQTKQQEMNKKPE